MDSGRELKIALVDDDEAQAALIEKNLKRTKIKCSILKFNDGKVFVDYLDEMEHPEDFIVLLDLNMPLMDGYEVLELMRSDQAYSIIPVFVLTTTEDEREIRKCYELGCNGYLAKPVKYDKFVETIHNLGLFLSILKTPN
jgi:CheY-like chemotaxis protein